MRLLNMMVHVLVATVLLVVGSNALSLSGIGASTVLDVLALSGVLTLGATAVLIIVTAAIGRAFNLKRPGFLLQTAQGTIAGAAAVCMAAVWLPALISLSFGGALLFALVNTLLIWALGALSGALKPGTIGLWPTRAS